MRLGYRSDIRILTTKKGFDVLKKYVDLHTNRDRDINLFDGLHVKEEGKTNIYFGWDFLKWYPGYESVDNVMNGLNYLKELDLSYHYKRFGENYDEFNEKYILELYEIEDIEKAQKLSSMLFTNELDKKYFMKQYIGLQK